MASGQSFRWRKDMLGVWWGTVDDSAMAVYQQTGDPHNPVYWQTFPELNQNDIFFNFFRLDVPLNELYSEWISLNPVMESPIDAFRGLRILRQPTVECFFSFQCASCNTVVKIERTVHKLAQRYGSEIELPDSIKMDLKLHRYPTIAELAVADERALRDDLWGYRAPRVINLAKHLNSKEKNWLESLCQYLTTKLIKNFKSCTVSDPKLQIVFAFFRWTRMLRFQLIPIPGKSVLDYSKM